MTEPTASPVVEWPTTWRGWLPAVCLLVLTFRFHPLLPNQHYLDADGYVTNAILLGLAVGTGLAAVRSQGRGDRLLGGSTGAIALMLVVIVSVECLR